MINKQELIKILEDIYLKTLENASNKCTELKEEMNDSPFVEAVKYINSKKSLHLGLDGMKANKDGKAMTNLGVIPQDKVLCPNKKLIDMQTALEKMLCIYNNLYSCKDGIINIAKLINKKNLINSACNDIISSLQDSIEILHRFPNRIKKCMQYMSNGKCNTINELKSMLQVNIPEATSMATRTNNMFSGTTKKEKEEVKRFRSGMKDANTVVQNFEKFNAATHIDPLIDSIKKIIQSLKESNKDINIQNIQTEDILPIIKDFSEQKLIIITPQGILHYLILAGNFIASSSLYILNLIKSILLRFFRLIKNSLVSLVSYAKEKSDPKSQNHNTDDIDNPDNDDFQHENSQQRRQGVKPKEEIGAMETFIVPAIQRTGDALRFIQDVGKNHATELRDATFSDSRNADEIPERKT